MGILVTVGEPAGIGPDLVVAAAQQNWPQPLVCPCDAGLLEQRAKQLGLPLKLRDYPGEQSETLAPGELYLIETQLDQITTPGQLDPANAGWVLNTLRFAGQSCLDQQFDAVVTAPVHKGVINDAGYSFTGHTEFFAEQAGVERVVMMLATAKLRVALATTHLPLRSVPDAIQPELLTEVMEVLIQDLNRRFGLRHPRILIAGLNPHAGEQGHLGREELEIIEPTLNQLRTRLDAELVGPLPADTLFTTRCLESADAVLAMYHDQGLPVLKSQGFGEAVNITLGLPYLRTSVDHGTALDLAGTGKASPSSLFAAIDMAVTLTANRRQA